MQGTYTPWVVYLSIGLAIVVSYTGLKLASQVSTTTHRASTIAWLAGGAIAMGIGIWSMHFTGMLALDLPIRLTYDLGITAGSFAIAVVTSGFALALVSRAGTSLMRLAGGAVLMGVGISTMHYCGMAGIRIVPALTYDPTLFAASIAIAILASFAGLWLAFNLRSGHSWKMLLARMAAAIAMGCAISGMHYTGMAAAKFSVGSYCLPGARLDNAWFAVALALFAFAIMAVTLITIVYDSYLARHLRERDRALEQADASARYATTHDTLTGLPNRLAMVKMVEQVVAEAQRSGSKFALMVLNVDRLKPINDSLGHEAGDELLREFSRRLRCVLRRGDMIGRLAGDEFTVLARDLNSDRDAQAIVAKILAALRDPFVVRSRDVHVSVSAGISMFPGDGTTLDLLLRRAETAMRCAKKTCPGDFRFFTSQMSGLADDRWALESDLRDALELGQLELHYQPKVDIATCDVRSAEALIRWRHPERGLVPPDVFIPIAEETGLIVRIGEWVLREACRQMRAWRDAGLSPVRVAVNLSARQFRDDDLAAVVSSALRDANLETGYLELELTESSVMHDPEKSAATLQVLSRMGVHISIDDFGTGYSSLSYLRRFPLDKLKIDRSFVRELMSNADDVAIVKAIISLAHSLRLHVVAEGVETIEQLEFLRGLGCDEYQGFYCSPAVPADAFARLVRRLRPEPCAYTEEEMLATHSRLAAATPS